MSHNRVDQGIYQEMKNQETKYLLTSIRGNQKSNQKHKNTKN